MFFDDWAGPVRGGVVGIAGEEVAAVERLVKSEVRQDGIPEAARTAGHARLALAPSRPRRRAP